MAEKSKELKLKVAEAIQDDVNKGIVRIDSSFMHNIGVRVGDIVEIEDEKKTVGIADRAYPGDIGLNIIRMDGITRKNARTGIGELVKVRKVDVKEAKKVIIAPARKGIMIRASADVFKQGLLGRAILKGDIVSIGGTRRRRTAMEDSFFSDVFSMLDESMMGFGFGDIKFVVADTNPKQAVIISDETDVVFNPEAMEIEEEAVPEVSYEDIGGLNEEIKKVREMVELPLKHPEIFERLGIEPPKGVLLHGPPGCGKTLLAKAVANETNSHFILINGPEIMSKYYGQSEENIRNRFEEAQKSAPSIIFIDEIDAIASKREETRGEVERRVVAQLLAEMDGLQSRGKVVVIAATNVPNILDPALRRPGRFDREIVIDVPGKEGRLNILKIHTRNMPINTSPRSIDPSLKNKETKEGFLNILKNISTPTITGYIPKNIDKKETLIEIFNDDLKKYFYSLIPKDNKKNSKDFLKKCMDKISSDISNLVGSSIQLNQNNKIENIEEIKQRINENILKLKNEQEITAVISDTVRDILLSDIANVTHGFVGADLAALAKEAAMIVLRKVLPELKLKEEEAIPKEILEQLRIAQKDFKEALKIVRPSALREVLIEKPNVKWTDIGGLEEVKQELKEAVEWPLKHPEAFKRLGVRAPRGILLYGAPGTGKTLLAKAVATESEANFILVKGPELLCISADTNIFTDFCGVRTIEEFYDNITPLSELEYSTNKFEVRRLKKPFYSYAILNNGELIKTKIKTVHKLWVDNCYGIEFSNNNKITGSKNQPLLTFRDNTVKWVKLEDIEIGDFVAYPVKLPTFDKKVILPFPKYKHIKKIREDKENYYGRIFSTKQITKLPKYVTPSLASFLGWFVAEGSISKEGVSICNNNKENQKEIKELFKQFVDEKRITVYKDKVVVYSTVLVKYLEEILGQKLGTKKCYTIRCPNIITKASKEIIISFLSSAFKGDGSFSDKKIEYSTMSKHLAEGISYMLTLLGIKYRFWQRRDKCYMTTISGKKEMVSFKNNVLNLKIDSKLRKEYNARYIIPPVGNLLKEAKAKLNIHYDKELPDGSFEHAISGRRRTGLLRLQQIMEIYNRYADDAFRKTGIYQILNFIAKGNVLWTTIKNKKSAKPQIMYDIETEHGSFIGGNIPLILHNSKWVGESEKAVREVFKKARQTAPTIVFFDEIDSLAPRRGVSFDSHVTERVVNQLLTEIDGLEEMHDVVVLAASNRPDIIDTGLLRPGRFDRMILCPVPDEKTRLEILNVHTKGMPLKGVNLQTLAKKTDGYVGADIEAVCREAAIMVLREDIKSKEITMKNFGEALEKVKPSVTKEVEKAYEELGGQFTAAKGKQMKEEKPAYMG